MLYVYSDKTLKDDGVIQTNSLGPRFP